MQEEKDYQVTLYTVRYWYRFTESRPKGNGLQQVGLNFGSNDTNAYRCSRS